MFSSGTPYNNDNKYIVQILERSDYVMISRNPFIKKSGKRFWVSPLLLFQHEAVNITSGVCIKQGGGRYHFTSTSLLKSETRLLNLMKIKMFSVLNLWFGHTCSGRFSDGWGSFERREKRFLKPNHDIPSTAETRAKNKSCQDLLGIGEY
ncbi:uncharacterized protein LOC115961700 isoform X2 [Quercus lobata]|uniref:uncharacterized protein LOC115961700 isoform X2 n=1 Tax=Quercus lobata TaxID=97700 RepID=UPI001248166B|nr:uncharacterized protein LOC115961700 isoform X2 [Quercus lobata]